MCLSRLDSYRGENEARSHGISYLATTDSQTTMAPSGVNPGACTGGRVDSRQGDDEASSHKVNCHHATTASQTTKAPSSMNPGACAGVE